MNRPYTRICCLLSIVCCLLSSVFFTSCTTDSLNMPYQRTVKERFTIRTDVSESFADKVTKHFTAAYDVYADLVPLKSKRSRPFKITIFKERTPYFEYQKKTSPTNSDVGYYVAERGELVLRYNGDGPTIRLLKHEAFHAYFEDRIIKPPSWLNEGMAQYVETMQFVFGKTVNVGGFKDTWIKVLSRIVRDKAFPSLSYVIDEDWPNRHKLSQEQYALSWSLVYFLKNKHEEKFNEYVTLLYKRKEPRTAFHTVFTDIEALNTEWQKFVKSSLLKRRLLKLLPGI